MNASRLPLFAGQALNSYGNRSMADIQLKTAPHNSRHPSTKQERHCYEAYNEFHRCAKAKGETDPECVAFKKAYTSLCPIMWVERWNEQKSTGTFPGPS